MTPTGHDHTGSRKLEDPKFLNVYSVEVKNAANFSGIAVTFFAS